MTDFIAEDELVPFMMDPQTLEDGTTHTESPYSSAAYKRPTAGSSLIDRPQEQAISGKGWGRVKKFVTGQSGFPKSVFFIVGTEFCERFSFYGMKAILVLYLTNILLLGDNTSTVIFHSFNMLCYFSPIIGAMIADGWLGKYKTIVYIAQIYMLGNAVMCFTALPPQTTGNPELVGPMIGLLLIGLGTGGIKPCVSAFGGDQFKADQEKEIQRFFSVFYFSINSGSLISTFITPILRHDVKCFGNDCYTLAFGVPAALMAVAIAIFVCGRYFYQQNPPSGNIVGEVIKAMGFAVKNRFQNRNSPEKKEHWLDWAEEKYGASLIEDIKVLLHVLFIFLPLPFFWALFDQQGSRWTLQAEHMDGRLGSYQIKPDQMQALNPVFILFFIPLFEGVIYPLLDKCNVPKRPLQRMAGGMILAAIAFILAGFVQLKIDSTEIKLPGKDQAIVNIINASPCPIGVESEFYTGNIDIGEGTKEIDFPVGDYDVKFEPSCSELGSVKLFSASLGSQKVESVTVYSSGDQLQAIQVKGHLEKSSKGLGKISFGYFMSTGTLPDNLTISIEEPLKDITYTMHVIRNNVSSSRGIEPGEYNVYGLPEGNASKELLGRVDVQMGGIYRLILQPANISHPDIIHLAIHMEVQPNSVSMLLQIPQYVIITCGEILFSITGLEFSYSQAPSSMKSCVQAAWLMTVAFGNLIVVIIAESQLIESQAMEFFLFAGLMGFVILLFSIMACCYVYITPKERDVQMHDTAGLVANSDLEESGTAGYQSLDDSAQK
nr:solute carrier family 15 member 2-like [Lytechinus pictus]XP_054753060.1 solute carrier family 15 member 2-like [Lytechinus pictus]